MAEDHSYWVMLRRGVSMHRDDCPVVGRPEKRFWKGPYPSRDAAWLDIKNVANTLLPGDCQGDCSDDDIAMLLAPGWDGGWEKA